jgi:hypothetical protein
MPYIAYHYYLNAAATAYLNQLIIKYKSGGSWFGNQASGSSASYTGATLITSHAQDVLVAHYTTTNLFSILGYAGSGWTSTNSPTFGMSGNGPAFIRAAMDGSDYTHLLASEYLPSAGKFVATYATNSSGSWTSEPLDPGVTINSFVSMAVEGARARNNRP